MKPILLINERIYICPLGCHTEVYPCHKGVCEIIIFVRYVTEGEAVELNIGPATMHVQRKQYWPCNAAAHKTYYTEDPHVAKEEKAIERRMIENEGVGDFSKRFYPVKPSQWQLRATFAT